ncbi:MAG: hypothetical protein PHY31_09645, partial [Smithellaceae bacterium]|nr:hypothetical protein [Smithellaceae bacterium]
IGKCGLCLQRCMFNVNSQHGVRVTAKLGNCMGCGLCVGTCMGKARVMEPRKTFQHAHQIPVEVMLD